MKRLLAIMLLSAVSIGISPSHAAFPGENGLIVYTTKPAERQDPGGPRYPGSDGNFKLWSRTPSGTRHYRGIGSNAEWSPDGQWLLFERRGDLMKMRADGSDLQTIYDGSFPYGYSWSPDGARIVFSDGSSLSTIRADGREMTLLRNDPDMCEQEPAWSPDGGTIAYTAFPPRQGGRAFFLPTCTGGIRDSTATDIFTIPSEGGGPDPIGTGTQEIQETQPEWPPTSNNDLRPDLIFLSRRVGSTTRSHIDGWNFTFPGVRPYQDIRHIWSGRGVISSAAMSPDGQRMVFAMQPGTEEDGDSELFVIKTVWTPLGLGDESYDQPEVRQLTQNRWDDFAPHWGPR